MPSEIYALIPARRGSRGVLRKNLALINGRSLVSIAIDEAIDAGVFSEIVVSTNDDEVAAIAEQKGVATLKRPEPLAGDSATADAVIAHSIEAKGLSPRSIIVYLQPTSPMRTAAHIKRALDKFLQEKHRAVISVKTASPSIYKAYRPETDGTLTGLFGPDAPYCARQQVPPLFLPNGAIYIFKVEDFIGENNQIPRSGIAPFIMDDHASIDVDTVSDLTRAQELMEDE